ncbi:MAG: tRNA dihydrouridine synthase DusB [Armatimonadetes bacterium]|nr:tRNA dihydrouridine synthase DusB [Armatimonadota bacterium]MBX3107686.1 tRNA dihydrouridine synthase DusB [Fimbriimonadaceae bacterium]
MPHAISQPAFKIRDVEVANPLVLAPMEDVSNLAFRMICKRIADPGLMFTEFVSAMAIHHNAVKTFKKMKVHAAERPLGIQIFGGDPGIMAETAKVAEGFGCDLVDINMGCWVPKVCRTGAGAALLKDPVLAQNIVKAVVDSVKVPVTVKVRAGWDYSLFAAPDLARRFQDAGAQMLTLHARFAKQGFEGQADWSLIKELRKVLTIPLIGNGDVKTPGDAIRMMEETGCDGVMVGRAAISNPWALARIQAALTGKPEPPEPTLEDRIATALEHSRLMIAHEAEAPDFATALQQENYAEQELRGLRALRGQLPLYIKGVPGAAEIRASLSRVSTYKELESMLQAFKMEQ